MKNIRNVILIFCAIFFAQISFGQEWSSWRQTDCLKGLDFRVKKISYNQYSKKYKWMVEFRNRYHEKIHFSCIAVKPSDESTIKSTGKTDSRLHADGNGGLDSSWFLVNSENDIYVFVNKIRVGTVDSGDYYSCDL